MGNNPICCQFAVNVKEACGRVPAGQQCNKFTCSCQNYLGNSCAGCSCSASLLVDDNDEIPDDYVPTPGLDDIIVSDDEEHRKVEVGDEEEEAVIDASSDVFPGPSLEGLKGTVISGVVKP